MITTVVEGKRGCGYRKEGGLYLRSDGIGRFCGALPIELEVCPTCHHGIKPARGWTWVNLAELAAVRGCGLADSSLEGVGCGDCPIADAKIQEVGLLWIGEKYYPSIADFTKEAGEMGLSRRITMIPKRFKLGETWVALAHRRAIAPNHVFVGESDVCDECMEFKEKHQRKAGIFHVFKPARIEYVVKPNDDPEKLAKLEARGLTLVRVVRAEEKEAA